MKIQVELLFHNNEPKFSLYSSTTCQICDWSSTDWFVLSWQLTLLLLKKQKKTITLSFWLKDWDCQTLQLNVPSFLPSPDFMHLRRRITIEILPMQKQTCRHVGSEKFSSRTKSTAIAECLKLTPAMLDEERTFEARRGRFYSRTVHDKQTTSARTQWGPKSQPSTVTHFNKR